MAEVVNFPYCLVPVKVLVNLLDCELSLMSGLNCYNAWEAKEIVNVNVMGLLG